MEKLKALGLILMGALLSLPIQAEGLQRRNKIHREPMLERLDDQTEDLDSNANSSDRYARFLKTGDPEQDINHYHNMNTHLGVDLGMMIPMGDFQSQFTYGPLIGVHIEWEAIDPLAFIFSWQRSSTSDKGNTNNAKLSINTLNLGAIAHLPVRRFTPFFKLAASFLFNDVNFNDGRTIKQGSDDTLTSIGVTAGIGMDFIVGRELAIGLEVEYHYSVPKKLLLSDGTNFDIASPFITTGLRVSF